MLPVVRVGVMEGSRVSEVTRDCWITVEEEEVHFILTDMVEKVGMI